MKLTANYQILQRDETGHAQATVSGKLPSELPAVFDVYARVVMEDNSMPVVDWVPCKVQGDDWSVELSIPEGGLYRIEVSLAADKTVHLEWATKILCLFHIGVGDIYVLTGQSNMSGYGRDTAFDPPMLGVHAYSKDGKWDIASHPLSYVFGSPYNSSAVSPALSFARMLHQRLNVPIAIVPAAVGGSPLSAWHPEEDGIHFREMLERIEQIGAIKGFVWIQGCSDATEDLAAGYYDRFCRMVTLWRERLGNLPFLTVQINRWAKFYQEEDQDRYWGLVRDAQRRAAMDLEGVSLVPSIDLPTSDGGHNCSGSNIIIGERLANTALQEIYHLPGQVVPVIRGAEYVDETHFFLRIEANRPVFAMEDSGVGMNAEDKDGLMDCVSAVYREGGLLISTARPYTLPAKFHSFWRTHPAAFCPRDINGMPLPACYNVEIEDKKGE